EDGSFTVTVSYPEDEWVYGYILSFGSNAEVIEPQYARELIRERLEAIMIKYR
ncbi:MAG: YafY family transcriptional regulator, partial [Clostridia bacterium]|nr:YafY family transcriptional regulator [Clostridia bacterium]